MKFSFGAKPKAPLATFAKLVQLGETLGFDAAWVPDQTFFPDPFVAMTLCALQTRRIGLVLGVANPYTRHPVQVARAVASLDDIAPGRVALGYGAGNRKELIVPLGGEQDRAVIRCREAVTICRRLLRGEHLHYRSETLVADGVELEMPPHPHISIALAVRGPLMLELGGELADTVVIGALLSPRGLRFALEHVERGAARAQRSRDDLELMLWITCIVTDEKDRWIEHYRPSAAHILAGAPPAVFAALELSESYMAELKRVYASGGSADAAHLVSDDLVLELAAIGSPQDVAEQLGAAADMGIDQIGILVNAPTVDESERALRRFAAEVMPRLC